MLYEVITNAAGIPDSDGQPWPTSKDGDHIYPGYPDVLKEDGIKVVDDATIRFTLTRPYAPFLSFLPWSYNFV